MLHVLHAFLTTLHSATFPLTSTPTTGSGAGTAFGPRCKKGDVMGCGILFPPDFSPDGDADDEADDLDSSPGDDELTDDGEKR